MSLKIFTTITDVRSFPRVSGDEPKTGKPEPVFTSFSPRERG